MRSEGSARHVGRAQASRVKFIFGADALEVRIGDEREEFDNAFVGGPNTWAYDSFVNWEFWYVPPPPPPFPPVCHHIHAV